MFYKKIYAIILTFLFIFSLTPVKTAGLSDNCDIILKYTVGSKQYYVGDNPLMMDSEPEIKDSRMFLVIRFVLQNIPGTTLDWNGLERKITIKTPSGNIIKLWIGNPKAEVNGKMIDIDPENPGIIKPYIKDGRTKVPMRFVGEQLNARIDWIITSSTVILSLFDSFNCDTTLLEGCISKWTEAPNDQYQIYFHKKCEFTIASVPYLISKTLNSKTEQIGLAAFFELKSATNQLHLKIWVTRVGVVRSWDPIPVSESPPPSEPPSPPPEPPAPCCNFRIDQLTQPIKTLKSGDSYFYFFLLRNFCPQGSKDISFQFAPISLVSSITPKQLMVAPGKESQIKVDFTMPIDCQNGTLVTFSFKMGTDCSEKEVISFTIQCDSKLPEPPPAPPAGPGRIIVSLGQKSSRATATFKNLSNPKIELLTIDANIKGSCDTGCKIVVGDTYRVTPKNEGYRFEPEFQDITVLESCPDGITRVTFDAIEIPGSCCDWQFRLTPGVDPEKWVLSPGETKIIEIYEIVNNCEEGSNDLKFAISWPGDGKIVSISPAIFTLVPKQRKTLIITIKMPEACKGDEAVIFPFTIIPKGCEKRDSQIAAFCKVWKCDKTSVQIKVLEIDLRAGWLSGVKLAGTLALGSDTLALPIRIHFDTNDNDWKNIVLKQCYEICYEERNDSSGKKIKWGLDYRLIPCPE